MRIENGMSLQYSGSHTYAVHPMNDEQSLNEQKAIPYSPSVTS